MRILSFGCATGEEIVSLRGCFPAARIKGIDIGAANVRAARRRLAGDFGVEIVRADSVAAEPAGAYDAILCLAVLRDGRIGDDAERSDAILRFVEFERMVTEFARCLKPGGLLALRGSNFRFEDTAVSRGFACLQELKLRAKTPKFDSANRRIWDAATEKTLFRKHV